MTAAAARKLQKEIDNVLKKVDDGICEFSDCWEQATAAGSNQQKEKLGEELKRSINKLQRFRVQIREWLAQSAVQTEAKDKLEEARKRVENDMQRFKDFERDLKTKAFSTCALGRGDELELEEAEKLKYQEWLTQTIQSLNDQLDQFEADLELLAIKKSLSNDDKARQGQLRTLLEQHRWHIKKLELVLRAFDNDSIEISDLAVVRESIDFYVDNNQEPDCFMDETLFDCFELAEYEEKVATTPKSPVDKAKASGEAGSAAGKDDAKTKAKDKEKRKKDDKKDKKREERDKKTAGVSQKAVAGGAKGAGGKEGASGDASKSAQGESREPVVEDEIKVQEDQLMSEAAEFVCKICQIHVAGCGPKLTSCSHFFCGDCIAQWFNQHPDNQTWAQRAKTSGPDRVVPCPVCKQPLNEKRDLYPVCGLTSRSENLLLWRMLSSLKIVCANHPKVRPDGKCDWVGEYGSYQKHASVCTNQLLGNVAATATPEPPPAQQLARSVSADSDSDACSTTMSRDTSLKSLPTSVSSQRSSPAPAPSTAPQTTPARSEGPPSTGDAASESPTAHSEGAGSASPSSRKQAGKNAAQQVAAQQVAPQPVAPQPVAAAPAVAEPAKAAQVPQPTISQAPVLPAPAATQARSQSPAAPPVVPTSTAPAVQVQATQAPKVAPTVASAPTVVPSSSLTSNTANVTDGASNAKRPNSTPEARARESGDGSFTAHAVSSFEGAGPNMVTVHIGDLIQVLEQHSSGWTYAKNLSLAASTFGWIPSWIVPAQQPVEEAKPEPAPQPKPQAQPAPVAAPAAAPAPVFAAAPVVAAAPAVAAAAAAPAPAAVQQQPVATPAVEARLVLRASATFAATSPSQLTLKPADSVEVVERHASGWTYGRKVSDRGEATEGWFPDWVIAQK